MNPYGILKEEHQPYLIFNKLGIIAGITEDAPEETKKDYADFLEFQRYCEENEIDY
jgi:hypothetical protein